MNLNLGCPVLCEGDEGYEAARRVWNGMIDRRPRWIVRPRSIADVMQAVRGASESSLPICVRGGGHSFSGKSVADGALMVDLSLMKSIQVDPRRRTVIAQGGVKLGEFDAETEKYGLATTGGVISTTGIAGLTLGGGLGWLMGKHGLTCDNLISADLVDAGGRHLSASATENPDLFWAIRGGGGNFGIVTAFEYQLHPLDSVHGGVMLYPRDKAKELIRQYRDITLTAPDELTAYAALLTGHGTPMAAIAMCHSGEPVTAERETRQFLLADAPIADMTGKKKYTEIQSMMDFSAPAGLNYYSKCPFLRELTDGAMDTIIAHAAAAPTEQTQVVIEHMHGAASRVAADATAFGLRRVHYSVNIMAAWDNPALAESCIAWARGLATALEAFGASDTYVNYLGDEGAAAVKASYGPNYDRLARLKHKYDPENVFRFNQNIVGAA
jgi:FAD/FMN-containing dehydrogenase